MEMNRAPWQWLLDMLPPFVRDAVGDSPWVVLAGGACVLGLLLLLMLFLVLRLVFGRRRGAADGGPSLEEDLSAYPDLKTGTGDRRLLVEGVPVRLRLVAVAPAGKHSEIDEDNLDKLLEKILPGLGHIFKQDRPRVRIWPMQLSYEGFTKHFHRNTLVPKAEGDLTPWVVVAGRAKLGKNQVMLGLALQALKPTTVGRLTVEAHEWESKLRVRVREA